jgi:hypothetical protein
MKRTLPELWLLLYKDYKVADLVKIGYNRFTVYKYHERLPQVLRDFQKAKQKIRESKY